MESITISKNFKSKAIAAVLSIVLFLIAYLVLIALAIGITFGLGYAGVAIIALKPSLTTLVLGVGVISIGVIILIFLVKFIFTRNKTDLSGYIEITEQDEPELFLFIKSIVKEVKTDFPNKVFFSSQVNASVFYNSSFWSMFLPVKKNLHIGLGLMNSTTVDEFKCILAHEFGHFSQRSMKIGSYVYNVNYILHNMLYDNDSYNNLIRRWANVSGYFSFFSVISIKITNGIQWLLRKVYNVVNLSYMALSREMEFHADEIAVRIAGSEALTTSLLRAELATHSLNRVFDFYTTQINDNISPENIFSKQSYIMNYLGELNKLPITNNLPQVSLKEKNRFDKSKIDFGNQWSSHPSDFERINRANQLNIINTETNNANACTLLTNSEEMQRKVTAFIISRIEYPGVINTENAEAFKVKFDAMMKESIYPLKYNSYYDNSEEIIIDTQLSDFTLKNINEETLFSDKNIDMVYSYISVKNDLETLKNIENGTLNVKSFYYDGIRYEHKQTSTLIKTVQELLIKLKYNFDAHNQAIFNYYKTQAAKSGKQIDYISKYDNYRLFSLQYDEYVTILNGVQSAMYFIQEHTPFEIIQIKLAELCTKENLLKGAIRKLYDNPLLKDVLNAQDLIYLDSYLSNNYTYFTNNTYIDDELSVLFSATSVFGTAINNLYFRYKKDLLDFQAGLTLITR